MEEYIRNRIAPRIQADGGWTEFVSFEKGVLTLIFRGECSKCMLLDRCVDWIGQEIRRDLELEVMVRPVRRKPFFWDMA